MSQRLLFALGLSLLVGCSGSSGTDLTSDGGASSLSGLGGGLGGGGGGGGGGGLGGGLGGGGASTSTNKSQDGGVSSIPSSATCDVSANPTPCGVCIEKSCCSPFKACLNNADCVALQGCVGQCNGDTSCIDECVAQTPNGKAALEALYACASQSCRPECS